MPGHDCRNAEFHFAGSQILNLQGNQTTGDIQELGRAADFKSAIRQSETLRYGKNFHGRAAVNNTSPRISFANQLLDSAHGVATSPPG